MNLGNPAKVIGCCWICRPSLIDCRSKAQGHWLLCDWTPVSYRLQSQLTATLLTSILAAVFGSLQIGYHTGNVNAPARVRREAAGKPGSLRPHANIAPPL